MKSKLKATLAVVGTILLVSAGFMFVPSSTVNAGLWDSMMNSDLEEVTPTANYAMEVYGYDARVYEWTPAWNQSISCVFISANKSSGVGCYPKAAE